MYTFVNIYVWLHYERNHLSFPGFLRPLNSHPQVFRCNFRRCRSMGCRPNKLCRRLYLLESFVIRSL